MKSSKLLCLLFSSLLISTSAFAAPPQKEIVEPTTIEVTTAQVNINTASVDELVKALNGIGLSKAKKIVEYREKMGPFVTIEQLKEVSGIGQAILDKNTGKITL
ncbi:ComEA family DNA-binding protein [Orbaceae bacterium ESL0721]|nr:ComEA family DNA-binding protein [Orbaceae bacterium ESL0721]